jgi:hypothetical protein
MPGERYEVVVEAMPGDAPERRLARALKMLGSYGLRVLAHRPAKPDGAGVPKAPPADSASAVQKIGAGAGINRD